ncbi:UDP-N-acetylmuramoyl-L-alanyl-D-glutamate--2,6-diaminopimelate ligase [Oryzibacter oryziterrae]|uniref:UDP-N-acetylmuramoyl-L-alanyl-D-glutamate--2, 6-diaminopimelate ligase n=1 Tax=Oryzibacter oryziterrae TaxID=2766474 RepID=UPI001F01D8E5|nr:UDP-N-acetylmuramoyl-L-alanyl-D-glutamate--2,6-diaminopimelate ligase [Oryzibacter oryziterrae]
MKLAELAPDILTSDPALRRIDIAGVTADSRAVQPGTLFAALPGTKVQGVEFIPQAVANGAAIILAGANDPIPDGLAVPVLRDSDPQRRFARLVARFYAPQPKSVVAVTGTNGKTSVASFVRQIWLALGHEAASLGTIGVTTRTETSYGNMTTPDPVTLHRTLQDLTAKGIDHVAMEASSHGIMQRRLDGLTIAAGAFTNLSRDHLDYHGTMEAYMAAKMRLFDTVLEPGAAAVINLDDKYGEAFASAARISGLNLITVGAQGTGIRIIDVERDGFAQKVTVEVGSGQRSLRVPLVGNFQVSNALVAAALAAADGSVRIEDALDALSDIKGARGRLELVAYSPTGAPIFVDYAHTPAALEVALETLRPYVQGKLVVAFGAGGDRDRGKRPEMGAVCERLADVAIVTDDNPRSEDPADIRAAVLEAAPGALEIGDRAEAIRHGISLLGDGDIFLVAGKGHETGQTIAGVVHPFSDHEAIMDALPGVQSAEGSLWQSEEFLKALGGTEVGWVPSLNGVSIDSRSVEPGDAFFAILGDRFDGHDFVPDALRRGAGVAVVSEARLPTLPEGTGPLVVVDDVLDGMRRLAARARARSAAKIIAVTGSVGKTSTKEALRHVLEPSGSVHASAASFNNHWGVPLTLARLPRSTKFGVFEIGMNHAGEITPLTRLVRPHVAIITTVAAVHMEYFPSVEAIARAKAEVFEGIEPGGTAVINRDNEWGPLLASIAREQGVNVVFFGEHAEADARLTKFVLHEDCSTVTADLMGEAITYKIGAPGRHLVDNSLAVLAAVKLVGGDLPRAMLALQHHEQPKGRGKRHNLRVYGGNALLIDESYNANPTSMRAAIALLTQTGQGSRRRHVAVLGDMLELGPQSARLHAELVEPLKQAQVDTVFCCGPLMHNLWQSLPKPMRGAYAEQAAGLQSALLDDLRAGDVVMVKGSLGSRTGQLVEALISRFGAENQI